MFLLYPLKVCAGKGAPLKGWEIIPTEQKSEFQTLIRRLIHALYRETHSHFKHETFKTGYPEIPLDPMILSTHAIDTIAQYGESLQAHLLSPTSFC